MLSRLGGVGVFILAALDSSLLPTLGAVDAFTIVLAARQPELWPYYAMCSTAGSVCGRFRGLPLVASGSTSSTDQGDGVRQSHNVLAPFWRPFSISRRTSSAGISDFRVRNWCRRSTLSVPLVRIVFRRRASVPLCSAGLPCLCVRPAVRDERLVGAHAGGSSGGRRCAGLCRVAGVAHLEEI
jgi:hypothetical protein